LSPTLPSPRAWTYSITLTPTNSHRSPSDSSQDCCPISAPGRCAHKITIAQILPTYVRPCDHHIVNAIGVTADTENHIAIHILLTYTCRLLMI
jgi:hypothetical protein